jgi:subtilisin family serine protease
VSEKRVLRSFGLTAAIAAAVLAVGAGAPLPARAAARIDDGARAALANAAPTDMLDMLVVLRQQARLPIGPSASRSARLEAVLRALRAHADLHQRPLITLLARAKAAGRVQRVRPFWIFNGLEVVAQPDVIAELAAQPAVEEIRYNATVQAPAAPAATTGPPEPNIALVNAPALWDRGHVGQGVVVASMDTGVDATHPALAASFRGGANSWYDPSGQHPSTPTDVSGHGTWTTGVMVGSAAGGTSVGVAPGARWIAAKIFDDRGVGTTARIHSAFQWLLDPDGNPSTDDAANVVDESWNMSGTGCLLEFQLDLHNLRAAGVLPVFSAGNRGPNAGSSVSPANNPEAFAVGGTDLGDTVDPSSSRGPSACGGQTVYPSITAPGVDVYTTDLYGTYAIETGTSLAAAHASGALALLLDAFPNLSAEQQETALRNGALDLGSPGADDAYGSGRLDVLAAYNWAASAPDFSVSATPGSASTMPGGSVSYDVAVAGVNDFSSTVSLALSGLPSGKATATFSPATITGGSGTSALTVATAATLAPGTYPLTISATAGTITRTAATVLVVTAPPDFTLSAAPASASTLRGGSVSYTLTAASQGGFAGTVTLSASGLPAGATATFSPTSIGGGAGTSTLTIATTTSVAPGSYAITLSGASGQLSHTATVTLVVTAAPDFAVAIAPASATVTAGLNTAYTVTVSALGGFAGNVSLSVSGLPSAATGSFSTNPVIRSGTSTLTIRTARYTTRGTFTIKVTGKSGTLTRQATATLVVKA